MKLMKDKGMDAVRILRNLAIEKGHTALADALSKNFNLSKAYGALGQLEKKETLLNKALGSQEDYLLLEEYSK